MCVFPYRPVAYVDGYEDVVEAVFHLLPRQKKDYIFAEKKEFCRK